MKKLYNKIIGSNIMTGSLMVIFFIILVFGLFCITAFIFQILWNWLIVMIFGLMVLNFWEAMGMIFLISFLSGIFNGFGNNGVKK